MNKKIKSCLFVALAATYGTAHAQETNILIDRGIPAAAIDDQQDAQQQVDAVAGNASLTDQKEWSDSKGDTVKDITNYTPGVFAQPRDGAESARLSVRGSGLANTFQGRGLLVLEDGVPINMADGEFEFPVIDPWLTQFAEVFPGADGVQYGASTFGGAINFITPNGSTDGGYDVRSEIGSFGTAQGLVSAGKQWQGGDLFVAADGYTQDGYRDQNKQDTTRFFADWGWQPSDDFTNRVYLSHIHADAQIPGALSLAQIDADPHQANATNAAGDYQRNLDITRLADKSAWTLDDDRIDTTLYYTYRTLDNPVTTYEFQHNNDVGMLVKFTHRYDESQWFAGINNYYGTADEIRYTNMAGTSGAHILSRDLYAMTSEAYGEIDQNLAGKLFGIAAVQGSYAMRDIGQSFPTAASQDRYYAGLDPRLGLRYDLTADDQLFANLSRSFEPPTWSELSGGNVPGFHDLKAQYATTAEIGARGVVHTLHWDAAYYHGWLHNEFVDYEFANGDTSTINAAHTKRDGIELGLNGDIAHDVWLTDDAFVMQLAYTYSHYTLDHDPLYGNNTLPGVPEHYLRAEMLYRHPSGVSFGPNVEWAPERAPVDLANTLYAPAYVLFGARAFWESADKRLNFYIEGSNLLNKSYVATYNVIPDASGTDGHYFYPGEGRAIYTGFGWHF